MDESCGHLHQVDESHYAPDHGCRRLPLIRNLKDTNDGGKDFSSPGTTINRAGRSLIDDPIDGKYGGGVQRRVQIAGEGDLDDEIGYIETQLNSSSQPPSQLQTSLSNASS
jgi:hypothetical protein